MQNYVYTKNPYIHVEKIYDNKGQVKMYHVSFDHKRLIKVNILDLRNREEDQAFILNFEQQKQKSTIDNHDHGETNIERIKITQYYQKIIFDCSQKQKNNIIAQKYQDQENIQQQEFQKKKNNTEPLKHSQKQKINNPRLQVQQNISKQLLKLKQSIQRRIIEKIAIRKLIFQNQEQEKKQLLLKNENYSNNNSRHNNNQADVKKSQNHFHFHMFDCILLKNCFLYQGKYRKIQNIKSIKEFLGQQSSQSSLVNYDKDNDEKSSYFYSKLKQKQNLKNKNMHNNNKAFVLLKNKIKDLLQELHYYRIAILSKITQKTFKIYKFSQDWQGKGYGNNKNSQKIEQFQVFLDLDGSTEANVDKDEDQKNTQNFVQVVCLRQNTDELSQLIEMTSNNNEDQKNNQKTSEQMSNLLTFKLIQDKNSQNSLIRIKKNNTNTKTTDLKNLQNNSQSSSLQLLKTKRVIMYSFYEQNFKEFNQLFKILQKKANLQLYEQQKKSLQIQMPTQQQQKQKTYQKNKYKQQLLQKEKTKLVQYLRSKTIKIQNKFPEQVCKLIHKIKQISHQCQKWQNQSIFAFSLQNQKFQVNEIEQNQSKNNQINEKIPLIEIYKQQKDKMLKFLYQYQKVIKKQSLCNLTIRVHFLQHLISFQQENYTKALKHLKKAIQINQRLMKLFLSKSKQIINKSKQFRVEDQLFLILKDQLILIYEMGKCYQKKMFYKIVIQQIYQKFIEKAKNLFGKYHQVVLFGYSAILAIYFKHAKIIQAKKTFDNFKQNQKLKQQKRNTNKIDFQVEITKIEQIYIQIKKTQVVNVQRYQKFIKRHKKLQQNLQEIEVRIKAIYHKNSQALNTLIQEETQKYKEFNMKNCQNQKNNKNSPKNINNDWTFNTKFFNTSANYSNLNTKKQSNSNSKASSPIYSKTIEQRYNFVQLLNKKIKYNFESSRAEPQNIKSKFQQEWKKQMLISQKNDNGQVSEDTVMYDLKFMIYKTIDLVFQDQEHKKHQKSKKDKEINQKTQQTKAFKQQKQFFIEKMKKYTLNIRQSNQNIIVSHILQDKVNYLIWMLNLIDSQQKKVENQQNFEQNYQILVNIIQNIQCFNHYNNSPQSLNSRSILKYLQEKVLIFLYDNKRFKQIKLFYEKKLQKQSLDRADYIYFAQILMKLQEYFKAQKILQIYVKSTTYQNSINQGFLMLLRCYKINNQYQKVFKILTQNKKQKQKSLKGFTPVKQQAIIDFILQVTKFVKINKIQEQKQNFIITNQLQKHVIKRQCQIYLLSQIKIQEFLQFQKTIQFFHILIKSKFQNTKYNLLDSLNFYQSQNFNQQRESKTNIKGEKDKDQQNLINQSLNYFNQLNAFLNRIQKALEEKIFQQNKLRKKQLQQQQLRCKCKWKKANSIFSIQKSQFFNLRIILKTWQMYNIKNKYCQGKTKTKMGLQNKDNVMNNDNDNYNDNDKDIKDDLEYQNNNLNPNRQDNLLQVNYQKGLFYLMDIVKMLSILRLKLKKTKNYNYNKQVANNFQLIFYLEIVLEQFHKGQQKINEQNQDQDPGQSQSQGKSLSPTNIQENRDFDKNCYIQRLLESIQKLIKISINHNKNINSISLEQILLVHKKKQNNGKEQIKNIQTSNRNYLLNFQYNQLNLQLQLQLQLQSLILCYHQINDLLSQHQKIKPEQTQTQTQKSMQMQLQKKQQNLQHLQNLLITKSIQCQGHIQKHNLQQQQIKSKLIISKLNILIAIYYEFKNSNNNIKNLSKSKMNLFKQVIQEWLSFYNANFCYYNNLNLNHQLYLSQDDNKLSSLNNKIYKNKNIQEHGFTNCFDYKIFSIKLIFQNFWDHEIKSNNERQFRSVINLLIQIINFQQHQKDKKEKKQQQQQKMQKQKKLKQQKLNFINVNIKMENQIQNHQQHQQNQHKHKHQQNESIKSFLIKNVMKIFNKLSLDNLVAIGEQNPNLIKLIQLIINSQLSQIILNQQNKESQPSEQQIQKETPLTSTLTSTLLMMIMMRTIAINKITKKRQFIKSQQQEEKYQNKQEVIKVTETQIYNKYYQEVTNTYINNYLEQVLWTIEDKIIFNKKEDNKNKKNTKKDSEVQSIKGSTKTQSKNKINFINKNKESCSIQIQTQESKPVWMKQIIQILKGIKKYIQKLLSSYLRIQKIIKFLQENQENSDDDMNLIEKEEQLQENVQKFVYQVQIVKNSIQSITVLNRFKSEDNLSRNYQQQRNIKRNKNENKKRKWQEVLNKMVKKICPVDSCQIKNKIDEQIIQQNND